MTRESHEMIAASSVTDAKEAFAQRKRAARVLRARVRAYRSLLPPRAGEKPTRVQHCLLRRLALVDQQMDTEYRQTAGLSPMTAGESSQLTHAYTSLLAQLGISATQPGVAEPPTFYVAGLTLEQVESIQGFKLRSLQFMDENMPGIGKGPEVIVLPGAGATRDQRNDLLDRIFALSDAPRQVRVIRRYNDALNSNGLRFSNQSKARAARLAQWESHRPAAQPGNGA